MLNHAVQLLTYRNYPVPVHFRLWQNNPKINPKLMDSILNLRDDYWLKKPIQTLANIRPKVDPIVTPSCYEFSFKIKRSVVKLWIQ